MTLDQRARRQDGADHQERQDHRAQAQGLAAGRRDHRLDVHEQEGAAASSTSSEIEDAHKTGVMFSLHVKATMMKVSHPIVFGHCVRIFYKEAFEKHGKLFDEPGRERQQRHGRPVQQDRHAARVAARRDHARPARLPRAPARAGDGRFGQGHHQLPFAQRRHRRRLDAGDDPRRRQDVRRRRPAEGSQGGHAREHLRPHLPGDHQLLQMARRVRPAHHGHRAQRRPDGAAGRGIRLARQDLRDPGRRRGQHHRPRHRRGAADAERRAGRHLAHVPGQGRADPRLGQAGGHARPQFRHAGRVLARPVPPARERADQEGQDLPAGPRHRRPGHPDHAPGARDALHARARDPRPGHHQRSPATSCATT